MTCFPQAAQALTLYRGAVGEMPYRGRSLPTAIAKIPVRGPVVIGTDGLAGDEQADHRYHGGPDQSVCLYPSEHYEHWQRLLGRDIPECSFGENILTAGFTETGVCVGDRLMIDDALLEISAPRTPCFKPGVRTRSTRVKQGMKDTGRVGFYARVLEPGTATAPCAITLIERPFPELTVATVYATHRDRDPDEIQAILASAAPLAARFRAGLITRLAAATPAA